MAGYIMTLDNATSLRDCVENGVYSTRMTPPKSVWGRPHEATFADYVTMRPGDNIYFFIDRKIYGIGEIVNVGSDCRYLNYPEASLPKTLSYAKIKEHLLHDESDASPAYRWICLFKPAPHFFKDGIDMDDMLSSNPNAFRMLRVFWKLSFLKIDDNENQAFRDALLKFNQAALTKPEVGANVYPASWEGIHKQISKKVTPEHCFDASPFLETCSDESYLKHEMAIELGLLYQLATKHKPTVKIFGDWDYLHHQVVASPFKPVDYMDKMDVFGYAFVDGYKPTIAKYLVGELKKDTATADDVEQLMKYVDWVKDEYAFGNYHMIRAFLVAHDFTEDAKERYLELASRRFIVGRRPAISQEWTDLTLVNYAYNPSSKKLDFSAK